ncbi:acyl-CoA dehydrogenase family protein [Halorubrum vacuolatum]|uniref:Acyl-CoA dehydrogenase n=1 Tax=Halorubrum vacuolatum TaxID=63740 RepID=A0A238XB91_HALVU|nr:acyl-CoA dehydrogenase family protein [Halorubrum vacuolatum]SNR55811.1 acyl-CoA dehydrogenase [Halorubrum vacuolatum]
MEYSDVGRGPEVAESVREFVTDVVLPVEREWLGRGPVSGAVIADLRDAARDRGIYAPQVSAEYGGLGLGFREMLPVFEEAGRSLLGPMALRCAAPDEGNMHTLEIAATEAQKERWLRPLAAGEIDSGFAMTEPLQGGGSDPKMLATTAEKDGDEWVIDGHKWWTTGGSEASVLLTFARTDREAHPYAGCSVILVPTDADGVEIRRDVPHVGERLTGTSHAEIRFDSVRVPIENTLGEENEGFTLVQKRLGPARLTHCMRYAGMADRALDIATAYLTEREGFGEPLSEKQGPRFRIADRRTELHAARCMVRHAAARIADGHEARIEVAMAKTFTANVVQEAIDDALQFCGGNGIGRDLPLGNFYENVRQFRIIDGADEVHRRSIARDAFEEPPMDELSAVTRYGAFE